MSMNTEVLERLLIEVVGDDSTLKQFLDDAVQAAEKAAASMRDALNLDWGRVTQGASEVTTAFDKVAPAVVDASSVLDQYATRSRQAFDDVRRAGRMTTEQFEDYRRTALETIETQRPLAQAAGASSKAMDDLARHVREATYEQAKAAQETERTAEAQEELEAVIKRLSNEVRSSRNVWAGRITSDDEFRQSTGAAREELLKLLPTLDRASNEYRKVTQELAYAQRGLDSVNKVASRGGLAWTAQIALANQFGQSLRGLGPAGAAAAGGLGLVQNSVTSLFQPVTMADVGFKNLAVSVSRFVAVTAPLAAAVGAVAGLTALGKLTVDTANYARELENATFRTGLTVEGLQELQHAARSTGVPLDLLNTTMQRLQRRAADANAGNAGLRAAFDRLGVTLTNANGEMRSTEDLLGQVADGLNAVENNAERLALAFKVFDTEGGRLLPLLSEGSDGIRALREEARQLGLVISGDAVLSLSQFQAELETVKQQFQVLKVEITAAFLPVFRDALLPLVRDQLVPWLGNLAIRAQDFSQGLFDTTEAGTAFRRDLVASIQVLISMAQGLVATTQAVSGLVHGVLSGAANLGAFLGTATADVNFRAIERNFRDMEATYRRLQQEVWDNPLKFNVEPWSSEQAQLAQEYGEQAIMAAQAAIEAGGGRLGQAWRAVMENEMGRRFGDTAANNFRAALDTLQLDVATWLEELIQNAAVDASPEVRRALTDLMGDAFGTTGGGVTPGAAPDVAAAARKWTERLAAELRFGLKDVQEVIDLLVPAIERQMTRATFALSRDGVDSEAYQTAVARLTVLQGLWNTLGDAADYAGIMAARAFEDNPGLIALGDIPEAAEEGTNRLQELGEAAVTAGAAFLQNLGEGIRSVTQSLADATEEYRGALTLLGAFDAAQATAAQRTRDATNAVRLMIQQGRDWAEITEFAKQYGLTLEDVAVVARELGAAPAITLPDFQAVVRGATLTDLFTALRAGFQSVGETATETGQALAEWFGPRWQAGAAAAREYAATLAAAAAAQLEAAEAAAVLDANAAALVESIGRIGVTLDPLDQAALDLSTAFNAGLIDADGYARGLEALAAAGARLDAQAQAAADAVAELDAATRAAADAAALAAATLAWESHSQRITDFLRVNQANLDDLRKAAQAAFEAGVIGADEFAEALDRINVMEVVENLRLLGQELGGTQGIIPNLMGDLTQAFAQFGAGNTTDAIATTFNAATVAVRELGAAFEDTERQAEAVLDLVIGAAAGIATAIGGPALGQAVGAIGNFVKSVLGDLSNGLAAIEKQVSQTASTSKYLGENLIRGIAAGATQTVSRGGVLGFLGFTKQALDDDAFRAGVTVAEGLAQGLVNTLRSGDFEEAWQAFIDDILVTGIVEAFMATALVQDALEEAMELIMGGDASGGAAALDRLKNDFHQVWQTIQSITRTPLPDQEELERSVTFSLPDATVSVLAAPQWALDLSRATERMVGAGDAMLQAATTIQDTFSGGITVTTQTTRGIDANRSL